MKKVLRIAVTAALLLIIIFCLTACVQEGDDPAQGEYPAQPPYGEEEETPSPYPEGYVFYQEQNGYSYGVPQRITYPSALTGTYRHATIVLPPGYDENRRYPVLYLLHGLDCDDSSWTGGIYGIAMNAHVIAANAHYFDGADEMILVCVNSLINTDESQPAWTSPDLTATYDLTGREITGSLMPYINSNYSTLTDRAHTAVAGFSMGGREAVLTAFAYQDVFGSIGAFSSASFGDNVISASSYVPDLALTGENFDYVQITCGSLDTLAGVSSNLKTKLEAAGQPVSYSTPLGMHSPSVWRSALYEFIKNIFR